MVPESVKPLGLFGKFPGSELKRGELLALAGALAEGERAAIASYLRAGAIVFAIMECTKDVIGAFPKIRRENIRPGVNILEAWGGAFAVSGGSAILTDGTFYWRLDAADYVEHYGIGLPEEFLCHGRSLGWSAPQLTPERVLAIDRYLMESARTLPR